MANRRLSKKLSSRLGLRLTRRTPGLVARRRDYLKEACSLLGKYIRLRNRAIRNDPHLFGPHSSRYFQDTVIEARKAEEAEQAILKVYGPPKPGDPPPPPGVWTQRYFLDPQWPGFRKWFREKYGS